MKYQCVRCGKIKETKQEMLTCSGSCRVAYHRYLKAGNPPLAAIKIDDVTPETSVLQTPPSDEQAIIDGFSSFTGNDDHDYITIPVSLYNFFMRLSESNTEKKSDFVPGQPTFTPPTEKPVAVFDEEAAKKRTIASTLAALDDF